MTGTSPPGPFRWGSTTCSVKAVATAASKALPPRSSMPMPTAVAIQWVDATTPKVPSISGRVVKGLGLMNPIAAAAQEWSDVCQKISPLQRDRNRDLCLRASSQLTCGDQRIYIEVYTEKRAW